MARLPRVIAEGAPHHVTQRGNARRAIFGTDVDRLVYLQLLRQYAVLHRCGLVGYCLMSNHVHLITVPERADSLPLLLRDVHGRYATYLNGRQSASGHVWQGRYYSCPLDTRHLWAALRYVERNPVRARMVVHAEDYRWSNAIAHGIDADVDLLLDLRLWRAEWTASAWREFTSEPADEEADQIRCYTHTGRPLGPEEFVQKLERVLCRRLTPQKGGRPRKEPRDEQQHAFDFALRE